MRFSGLKTWLGVHVPEKDVALKPRTRPADWVLLVLLLGIVAMRFATLNRVGYWLDEIMEVRAAGAPTWGDFFRTIPNDKPPLEYVVLRLWGMVGSSEFVLRLPSALCSLLTLVVVWLALPRGTKSLFACLLIASHPLHFRLSQELLPYSSFALYLLLYAVFLVRWMDRGIWRWWAAACLAMVLAALTNLLALYAVSAMLLGAAGILGMDRRLRGRLWGLLGFVGVFAAIEVFFLFRIGYKIGRPPPWGFPSPGRLTSVFGEQLVWGFHWYGRLLGILLLLCLVAGIWSAVQRRDKLGLILVAWIFLGVPFLLVGLFLFKHWLAPRYLVTFVIPLSILEAEGLAQWTRRFGRSHGAWVVLAFGVLLVLSRSFDIRTVQSRQPDYRGAMDTLRRHPGAQLTIVDDAVTGYCYDYYRETRFPECPPSVVFAPGDPDFSRRIAAVSRVYLFPVLFDGHILQPELKTLLKEHGATSISVEEFSKDIQSNPTGN